MLTGEGGKERERAAGKMRANTFFLLLLFSSRRKKAAEISFAAKTCSLFSSRISFGVKSLVSKLKLGKGEKGGNGKKAR